MQVPGFVFSSKNAPKEQLRTLKKKEKKRNLHLSPPIHVYPSSLTWLAFTVQKQLFRRNQNAYLVSLGTLKKFLFNNSIRKI